MYQLNCEINHRPWRRLDLLSGFCLLLLLIIILLLLLVVVAAVAVIIIFIIIVIIIILTFGMSYPDGFRKKIDYAKKLERFAE